MGNVLRTIQNLEVVEVDKENHLLLVKGSVPGKAGYVVVKAALKKKHKVKKVASQVEEKKEKKKEEKEKKPPKKQ